jgi:hypothetical protein
MSAAPDSPCTRRRAGLQYVYHNHDFEFAEQAGGIGYDLLLKVTDPGLVQFEIDCGWMVLGGRDPRDYFLRYPDRFPMIHVKDFLPMSAHSAEHQGAELGRGMIDYGPIFAVRPSCAFPTLASVAHCCLTRASAPAMPVARSQSRWCRSRQG